MRRRAQRVSSVRRLLLLAATGASGFATAAHAATGTWNTNASGIWSDTALWTGGFPTAAGDIANVTLNITGTRTITIDGAVASRTVGTLTIGDISTTSNSFAIAASGGGTLTFNNSGSAAVLTQNSTSNGDTISAPVILADSLNVTNAATVATRVLTLSTGGISAGSAGTKNITILGTAVGNITFSGPITPGGGGDIAIVKGNANNALTLSGVNTFAGGVTLNAGTLNLNSSTALGATGGAFTINGGTVASTSGSAITLANNNPQNWNGNFTFAGNQALNLGTGAVSMNANRQITMAGANAFTVGGAISGVGFSLTTNNGATSAITAGLILTGANSYTGGTNINGGIVGFTNAAAIPATGTIVVGTGGALGVGPGSAYATPADWLADVRLSTTSTGALAMTTTNSDDYSPGAFSTLSLGTTLGASVTYTGNYTPGANGYFVGGGGGTTTFPNANFNGANNMVVGNGGGGTVVLSAVNTYTGSTTVTSGFLHFASIANEDAGPSSLGNPAVGTGTINLGVAGGSTAGLRFIGATSSTSNRAINLLVAGTIEASGTSGAVLTLNNPTAAVTGTGPLTLGGTGAASATALNFTGAFTKTGAGTWTLNGINTYTGTTTISAGTLILAGGNNSLPTSTAVVLGSATLNLGGNSQTISGLSVPAATTVNATINGGGSLIVNSASDLQFAPSTSANTVTVNLSALSSFTYNGPANDFRVGLQSGGTSTGVTTQIANVTLSPSNTITAVLLAVADENASSNPGTALLSLGQANILNANTFNIGSSGRSGGTLTFAAGLTNPTVTIRGTAGGTTPVTSFLIGLVANNQTTVWTDIVNFSAGTVDARVTTMLIGTADNGTASDRRGTVNASFTMGAGDVTIGTLTLGRIAGTGTVLSTESYNGNGTFTVNNAAGTLNVTTMNFAENVITSTGGTARTVSGTFNLTDGTVKATTIQRGAQTGTATSVSTTFNWTTGTVQNTDGANLAINNIPITLLTTASHTFNITGSNTATVGVGSPIGGATFGITKIGTGTLTLAAVNTYTGRTTVSAGTLAIAASERLADTSPMTLAGGTLATGGFSEILGELAVSSNSTIDFGSGTSSLTYANSSGETWAGTLTINNWSGDPLNGAGTDRLFFGNNATGLTAGQLSAITFAGFDPGALILPTGEVVPVPEPSATAAAAGFAVGLLARRRRRA